MMVSEKQLDDVWNKWLDMEWDGDLKKSRYYGGSSREFIPKSIKRAHRKSSHRQKFENWLWEQGGNIVQENKKLGIMFHTDQQAIMFLLKWS